MPTPPDHEALAEQLRHAQEQGADALRHWLTSLRQIPNDDAVVEVLLAALEQLRAEDGALLPMMAATELALRGQTAALARLRAVRPQLPGMPGGLRDYRQDIDHAIAVLEGAGDEPPCRCAVAAEFQWAPGNEGFAIAATDHRPEERLTNYDVRCERCGRQWQVQLQDGYHYPIYRWW